MLFSDKKAIIFLSILLMAAIGFLKADTITLNNCLYTDAAPRIDGLLDDNCWKEAKAITGFFDFWTSGKPGMKQELKLCFDKKALYLGAVLFEDNIDKIRTAVASRDDPDYWKDDFVEICISPDNNPETSFRKFCVNPIGTQVDIWQHGDCDYTWNGGWQAQAKTGKDRWILEVAIPWDNFEKGPVAGDIWTFEFIRFAYSTGALQGVSLSPGARHGEPAKFGLLLFENKGKNIENLVETICRRKGEKWESSLCGGKVSFESYASVVDRLSQQEDKLLARVAQYISEIEASKEYSKTGGAYKEEFEKILASDDYEDQIIKLEGLIQRTDELRWKAAIRALSE